MIKCITDAARSIKVDYAVILKGPMCNMLKTTFVGGADTYKKHSDRTLELFKAALQKPDSTTLSGVSVSSSASYSIQQNTNCNHLYSFSLNDTLSHLRFLREKISWEVHSFPDTCLSFSSSSQTTEKIFSSKTIKSIKKHCLSSQLQHLSSAIVPSIRLKLH